MNKNQEQAYRPWTETRGDTKRSSKQPGQKTVFQIVERNGQSFWNKVGVAFTNKDNSITVLLDAIPLGGKLQLRDSRRDRGPRKGE